MLFGVTESTDTKSCFGCKTWLVYGENCCDLSWEVVRRVWWTNITLSKLWDGKEEIVVLSSEQSIWLFNYEIHSEISITEYWPWSFSGWERERRERVVIVICKNLFVALHSYMGCKRCTVFTKHVSQNRSNCQFREVSCYIQSYMCCCTVSPYFWAF